MVLLLSFSPMSESHGLEDPSWYWGPGCRLVCGGSGDATLHSAGLVEWLCSQVLWSHVHATSRTRMTVVGSSFMGVHERILLHRATMAWTLGTSPS